jgi:TPR repeat protein
MFLFGQGVRADIGQAWTWLARADRSGFATAARYLKNAAARMDNTQLAQARERLEMLPG